MEKLNKEIAFRKTERAALSFIILLVIASYAYTIYFRPKLPKETTVLSLDEIISEVEIDTVRKFIKKAQKKKTSFTKKYKKPKLVAFDPNKTDSMTWIQLGLKPWTISNIRKYQAKGGQFYNCEDLEKIYSLETNVYQSILPYCRVNKSKKKSTYKKKTQPYKQKSYTSSKSQQYQKPKKLPRQKVDINTADTTALQSLYGIGPYYSKRIVEYRTRLGGFLSLSQLTEVEGVENEVIDNNQKRLTITPFVRKLNINHPADTLALHPYIRWKKAKVIANYRKHHGDFQTIEDLKKVKIINDSMYNRLTPYIKTK